MYNVLIRFMPAGVKTTIKKSKIIQTGRAKGYSDQKAIKKR